MEASSSSIPWLDQPVLLHSSRADTCTLTPEQCDYRRGFWRYWYVTPFSIEMKNETNIGPGTKLIMFMAWARYISCAPPLAYLSLPMFSHAMPREDCWETVSAVESKPPCDTCLTRLYQGALRVWVSRYSFYLDLSSSSVCFPLFYTLRNRTDSFQQWH